MSCELMGKSLTKPQTINYKLSTNIKNEKLCRAYKNLR